VVFGALLLATLIVVLTHVTEARRFVALLTPGKRQRISPLARKLAAELAIDLSRHCPTVEPVTSATLNGPGLPGQRRGVDAGRSCDHYAVYRYHIV